jgi:hypothetical protein
MTHRPRTAATAALFGFVVATLGGCSAGNPVAPSLPVGTSGVGTTMEAAN